MKITLPLIGEIKTGKDADTVVEVIKEIEAKKKSVGGTFLDFGEKKLTTETTVSTKLLDANKGWVYRNNDVIAQEVATIQFELYTVKTVRDEVIYDRIYTHELLNALNKFNEFTSAYDGFYTTQSHRKLAGDSFWYVDKTGLKINNIFILPPDKVTINLGKTKGISRVIQSYTYQDTIKGVQIKETYKPEEIIHFKVPNPSNAYRGKSAVEAAADAIDTDNMAVEANKKLFERGLIAELILSTDKSLTPEQIKALHSEFRNTYSGVRNAFKVPIFHGGIEPKNIQMTNKDAQFLEQQAWLRDKICSIFGNPKSIITTDDVNRANADATITHWKRTTISSNMKGIVDTLNEFLVPLYGDNLLLGFCDPVEEDVSQKITDVTTLKDADLISINEAREEIGREPVDGGDEFSFQRGERRIQQMPDAIARVNHSRVVNKALAEAVKYKKLKQAALPYAAKLVKSGKKDKRLNTEKVMNYYERQMRIVDATEEVFYDRVLGFINKMVDKALEAVPNEVTDMQKKKSLIDKKFWIDEAIEDFYPILLQVATQAGNEAFALVDKSKKSYIPNEIRPLIKKRVKKFATSMVETDLDKMTDIIIVGVSSRTSIPEIKDNIEATFKGAYDEVQAQRITRTEVLSASNQASIDAYEQTGEVEGKQWLTAPDADEDCSQYEGQIVGLKGNFYDTSEFQDGDPPLHPNCRCVVLPVLKGEMAIGADIKIKRLEDRVAELSEIAKEAEASEALQKQLDTTKKTLAKLKKDNEMLKQEKQELEEFLNES